MYYAQTSNRRSFVRHSHTILLKRSFRGHGLYHSHKFISSLRHRALRLDSTRDAIHISFRSVLKLRAYELSI